MNHFTPGTIHSNAPFVSTSIYFLKKVSWCLMQLKMLSQQKNVLYGQQLVTPKWRKMV